MNLKVLPSECDCEKCSNMCHAPCCGTVEDIQNLIDHGFGDRLMLDDWEDAEIMIKPALKFSESQTAPYNTASELGCTFWIDGKCELHNIGLKPLQGKLAHHSLDDESWNYISKVIRKSWQSEKANSLIKKWEKIFLKKE